MRNTFRSLSVTRGVLRSLCVAIATFALLFLSSKICEAQSKMKIDSAPFGKTSDGKSVTKYTLTNSAGNTIEMIDYGAIVVSINVPDKAGKKTNVTAGFSAIDGYLQRHPYFGATVGRFCNRIANGKFSIDGKEYSLATNNGPNHLHGGKVGFDMLMWKATELKSATSVGLRFTLTSPDGDEGYPGTLQVVADYVWDNTNRLTIQLSATTDKSTHVNLTNHAYFNLGGAGSGTIYKHELMLACDQVLDVNDTLIPTGKLLPVAGTALDFVSSHPIGDKISEMKETNGYDHCYVVRGDAGKLRLAAKVVDPASGRTMEVQTTQPGIQLYTGNFLDGTEGNGGYKLHEAFCLETQHFPDSPNQPSFPTTLLKPAETFKETTTYTFGVK
jgi:aldose 1-epimerase